MRPYQKTPSFTSLSSDQEQAVIDKIRTGAFSDLSSLYQYMIQEYGADTPVNSRVVTEDIERNFSEEVLALSKKEDDSFWLGGRAVLQNLPVAKFLKEVSQDRHYANDTSSSLVTRSIENSLSKANFELKSK